MFVSVAEDAVPTSDKDFDVSSADCLTADTPYCSSPCSSSESSRNSRLAKYPHEHAVSRGKASTKLATMDAALASELSISSSGIAKLIKDDSGYLTCDDSEHLPCEKTALNAKKQSVGKTYRSSENGFILPQYMPAEADEPEFEHFIRGVEPHLSDAMCKRTGHRRSSSTPHIQPLTRLHSQDLQGFETLLQKPPAVVCKRTGHRRSNSTPHLHNTRRSSQDLQGFEMFLTRDGAHPMINDKSKSTLINQLPAKNEPDFEWLPQPIEHPSAAVRKRTGHRRSSSTPQFHGTRRQPRDLKDLEMPLPKRSAAAVHKRTGHRRSNSTPDLRWLKPGLIQEEFLQPVRTSHFSGPQDLHGFELLSYESPESFLTCEVDAFCESVEATLEPTISDKELAARQDLLPPESRQPDAPTSLRLVEFD